MGKKNIYRKKEQGKNSKTSKRKAKLDMRQRDKH